MSTVGGSSGRDPNWWQRWTEHHHKKDAPFARSSPTHPQRTDEGIAAPGGPQEDDQKEGASQKADAGAARKQVEGMQPEVKFREEQTKYRIYETKQKTLRFTESAQVPLGGRVLSFDELLNKVRAQWSNLNIGDKRKIIAILNDSYNKRISRFEERNVVVRFFASFFGTSRLEEQNRFIKDLELEYELQTHRLGVEAPKGGWTDPERIKSQIALARKLFSSDVKSAFQWYQKASNLGGSRERNEMMLKQIEVAEKKYKNDDFDSAIEWYQKAADLGSNKARDELINKRMERADKLKTRGDVTQAIKLYTEAANLGIAQAKVALGFLEKDPEKKKKWFQESATAGLAVAQRELAKILLQEKGNDTKAVKWLEKAANQSDGEALFLLAKCYKDDRGVAFDGRKALDLFFRATRFGKASEAYLEIARIYEEGCGEVNADMEKALRYYSQSNSPISQARLKELKKAWEEDPIPIHHYYLGLMFLFGYGVPADPAAAYTHFKQMHDHPDATRDHQAQAQYGMGRVAENGYKPPDAADEATLESIAFRHYKASADAGFPPGMCACGRMISANKGGVISPAEIYQRRNDTTPQRNLYSGTQVSLVELATWQTATINKKNLNASDVETLSGTIQNPGNVILMSEHYLLQAARCGDASAQYELSKFYNRRTSVIQPFFSKRVHMEPSFDDQKYRFKFLRQSAENGYPPAEYDLAMLYSRSNDPEQYRYWLERAKDHGHPEALKLDMPRS